MNIGLLLCRLSFHPSLRVVDVFSGSTRKVQCPRCERYFTIHAGMQVIVPWDDEAEEIYSFLLGRKTLR